MTSPNFPRLYPKNHWFTQTITVPEGKAIKLHFTDFNTELGTDFITVTSGNSYYPAPHLSGNSLPKDIVSPYDTVHVIFKTHHKSRGRSGWRLEWSEVAMPTDVRPPCRQPFEFQLATGCYKVRHGWDDRSENFTMTWSQAMAICQWPVWPNSSPQAEGWNLANIESEEESMAVASILGLKYGWKRYWIALADFEEEANWTWLSQETIDIDWSVFASSMSYRVSVMSNFASLESYRASVNLTTKNVTHEVWAPAQPDNQRGNETCAYLFAGMPWDDRFGKWNTYSCDKNYDDGDIRAICKHVP